MSDTTCGPLPSRRVLDELRPVWHHAARGASPTSEAFAALAVALAAHGSALIAVDRTEADLAAARELRDTAAARRPRRADDGAEGAPSPGLRRPHGAAGGQRRRRGVGSKRRAFIVRAARERRLGRQARVLTARLLSTPCAGTGDIALKLAAIIAAGEAGPPEAAVFPWVHLRRVAAELLAITGAGA